jgi:hypothetical protein
VPWGVEEEPPWETVISLEPKERHIKELEEENRKLKQQLKAALGKAYDRL